jgi:hypothetical protein
MAAGAAAVLFGLDPAAKPADVKNALIASARPAPAWQGKTVSGGVLDLHRAVLLFAQMRGLRFIPDAVTAPKVDKVTIDDTTISATDGATIRLTSNVPGTATIAFAYTPKKLCSNGKPKPKPPKKCPKSLLVARPAKTRVVRSATITRPVVAGRNKIPFNSRISATKRLAKGSYRVTVTVRDTAGVASPKRTLYLRVTR